MNISMAGLKTTIATLWCCHSTLLCRPIMGICTMRACLGIISTHFFAVELLLVLFTGSPCETYSAARHHPPPPDWEGARWPRPLRSHDFLFGLEKLTSREMRQLHQGSIFFMQVVEVLVWVMNLGGVFVAETPSHTCKPFLCKHLEECHHSIAPEAPILQT